MPINLNPINHSASIQSTVASDSLFLDLELPDGGPIYTETNLNQFIVEPYNTASAILFLVMAVYWFWKLRGNMGKFTFLTTSIGLLTVGAVGGIIYHAFRLHSFFLYMDWLPILLLCLMASVYFFQKVFESSGITIFLSALFCLLLSVIHNFLPGIIRNNLSYLVMGGFVLTSTVLVLRKYHYYYARFVGYSLMFFVIAVICRISDKLIAVPMGTHFLWHTFGALAGHYMFAFIYKISRLDNGMSTSEKGRQLFKVLARRKKMAKVN